MRNTVKIQNKSDLRALDPAGLSDLMVEHGYVHFKSDCVLEPESFIEFSNRFSEKFIPYIGGGVDRTTYKGDPTVLFAEQGEAQGESIELHGEQHYQFDKPDKIWFYCLAPAKMGGLSLLADGVEIFEKLPADIKRIFDERRVMYRMFMVEERWKAIFQTTEKERIIEKFEKLGQQVGDRFKYEFLGNDLTYSYKVSATPKIYNGERAFINNLISLNYSLSHLSKKNSKTIYAETLFEDGSEIPRAVLDKAYGVAQECTKEVQLDPNSFLMIDNRRVMHGRTRFEGIERKILVRISKFHEGGN